MRDGRAIAAAIIPGRTKMVWLESPANPLWDVPDIHRIAEIAHAANAVVAVDSTCATPLLTRPLEHGADIVMHSATKYLNGHSDVMAGALATARDDEFWQRIVRLRTTIGQLLGPLEGYLLVRGMRTFPLRVATACESAMILAKRLSTHPRVVEVLYPGLPSHPDHQVAQRKMHGGYGGICRSAWRRKKPRLARPLACNSGSVPSLGGVESLIEHRRSIEGIDSPCPPDLLRLSVGIEDVDDLYRDLDMALVDRGSLHIDT